MSKNDWYSVTASSVLRFVGIYIPLFVLANIFVKEGAMAMASGCLLFSPIFLFTAIVNTIILVNLKEGERNEDGNS